MEGKHKRPAEEGPWPSKRQEACRSDSPTDSVVNPLATAPSALDIRAFGLEDRAEAVISCGKESWTLAHLSKWRHDTLDKATNVSDHSKLSSKEYLRQRQRAYRHQCLASNRDFKHPES